MELWKRMVTVLEKEQEAQDILNKVIIQEAYITQLTNYKRFLSAPSFETFERWANYLGYTLDEVVEKAQQISVRTYKDHYAKVNAKNVKYVKTPLLREKYVRPNGFNI